MTPLVLAGVGLALLLTAFMALDKLTCKVIKKSRVNLHFNPDRQAILKLLVKAGD